MTKVPNDFVSSDTHSDYTRDEAVSTFGGEEDTWGTTWTAAELIDPTFAVLFDVDLGAGTIRVDEVSLEVFYYQPLTNYDADGLPDLPDDAGPYLGSCTGDNQRIVLVGLGGVIVTSDDLGETWTSRNSGVASTLWDVEFGDGKYIAVGETGVTITSTDAITWFEENAQTQDHQISIAYHEPRKNFVAVGKNDSRRYRSSGVWQVGRLR